MMIDMNSLNNPRISIRKFYIEISANLLLLTVVYHIQTTISFYVGKDRNDKHRFKDRTTRFAECSIKVPIDTTSELYKDSIYLHDSLAIEDTKFIEIGMNNGTFLILSHGDNISDLSLDFGTYHEDAVYRLKKMCHDSLSKLLGIDKHDSSLLDSSQDS